MLKNSPAMWETWVQSLGWEDPLEKGTATHSSILAWRIPWIEQPGRLQSMGPQVQTRPSKFHVSLGFSGASDGKESACSMEKLCSVPGSGRSLGEGNGNPLQYSCLENPMDGGAWWATVHGVAESDMTE